jgi:hypothetical protein
MRRQGEKTVYGQGDEVGKFCLFARNLTKHWRVNNCGENTRGDRSKICLSHVPKSVFARLSAQCGRMRVFSHGGLG